MIPQPHRGGEATVACGNCRACCHQVVILLDDETGYDVEQFPTPSGVVRLLRRHVDGSCIYLVNNTYSIYELRPSCCRHFDCGAWYRSVPPKMRKEMLRAGGQERRMAKEGRKRA